MQSSIKNHLEVYFSYIKSFFEYALPAWITVSTPQINQAIKLAFRLAVYINNQYIHQISGIKTIKDRQAMIGQKYLNRGIHNPSRNRVVKKEQWATEMPLSIMLQMSKPDCYKHNLTPHTTPTYLTYCINREVFVTL